MDEFNANIEGLPQNTEAEAAVLGCMLLGPTALSRALEVLAEEDFYSAAHREIFLALKRLAGENRNVDLLMLCNELANTGMLEAVGSLTYVSDLERRVPSTANLEKYLQIVEEKALLRRLIDSGSQIAKKGRAQAADISELIDESERLIYDIAMRKKSDTLLHIRQSLGETYGKIGEAAMRRGGMSGVPTGFEAMDAMLHGLQPSDLVIVAGRPSMGKTSLAMNMAQHAALNGSVVAVFSLEMSRQQLVQRLLCTQGRVDMERIPRGDLTDDDYVALANAVSSFTASNMYIDDTSGISIPEMRSKCRRLKLEVGLDMIVIDYLQLMSIGGRVESRTQEVSKLSRELKGLARELNVPVVLLSQLSRGPESRRDKRPMLSDLRESGAIEQDADVVMLIFRKSYYEDTGDSTSEINIAKHRNGATGRVLLGWQGQYTRFENLSLQQEEAYLRAEREDLENSEY